MQDLIGKIIKKRYKVEKMIGRGGMAEVYKAYDKKRADYLAVKVMRDDLARDKIFLRRFQREAQTLAKLQHRNIVRFYGLEQEGMDVFMLMDYIEGESLRDEIFRSSKPFSNTRVLEIMGPVCSALHYAHEMGIAHCDIKPANILVSKHGEVFVSDFGIARMVDSATSTMVGIGAPAYMPPELVRGQDPTPQSDIYSLGIVLYEMLTGGERPFTGERATVTGTTAEKVRWEQVKLAPVPPSRYNKSISKSMEAVVLRCLEKEPGKRFSSSMDLLDAVRQPAAGTTAKKSTAKVSSAKKPVKPRPKKKKTVKKLVPFAITGATVLIFAGFLLTRGKSSVLSNMLNLQSTSTPFPKATASPKPTNTSQPTATPTPPYVVGKLVYQNDFENKKLDQINLFARSTGYEEPTIPLKKDQYGFFQENNGNTHLRFTGSGFMTHLLFPNFEQDFRFAFDLRSLYSGDSGKNNIEVSYRTGEILLYQYILSCNWSGRCYLSIHSKEEEKHYLLKQGTYPLENDTWYHFEIIVFGSQHWFKINDTFVLQAQDDRNTDAGEYLYFELPNNAITDLDNLEVYRLEGK